MGRSVDADDYIVKPGSTVELLICVRAILRRSISYVEFPAATNQVSISDLSLDLDSQTASKGIRTIPLTYTEFQIPKLLALTAVSLVAMALQFLVKNRTIKRVCM